MKLEDMLDGRETKLIQGWVDQINLEGRMLGYKDENFKLYNWGRLRDEKGEIVEDKVWVHFLCLELKLRKDEIFIPMGLLWVDLGMVRDDRAEEERVTVGGINLIAPRPAMRWRIGVETRWTVIEGQLRGERLDLDFMGCRDCKEVRLTGRERWGCVMRSHEVVRNPREFGELGT